MGGGGGGRAGLGGWIGGEGGLAGGIFSKWRGGKGKGKGGVRSGDCSGGVVAELFPRGERVWDGGESEGEEGGGEGVD